MQAGDGPVKKTSRKLCACWARSASRSTRKHGNGIAASSATSAARSSNLVADRDRRHPDHPAARRDQAQAGFGDAAVFGVVPESSTPTARCWKARPRQSLHRQSWPGQMRTVYGDHDRFTRPISPPTGQVLHRRRLPPRRDGYYWITGRVDDVINVSGHRMGTAEVESSLVAHAGLGSRRGRLSPRHQGPGHLRLCHPDAGNEAVEALRKELMAWVRKDIGPIASPDVIQFAPGLPKTRSGKIMRRILRKIAEEEPSSLGDTSTLADPAVVDDLVAQRQNKKGAAV